MWLAGQTCGGSPVGLTCPDHAAREKLGGLWTVPACGRAKERAVAHTAHSPCCYPEVLKTKRREGESEGLRHWAWAWHQEVRTPPVEDPYTIT